MRYMKSDIYFMTLALLSVWKVGVLKNYMGIVVCNANDDLIKIQCMKKDEYKNDACMAAVFFRQNILECHKNYHKFLLIQDNVFF